MSLKYLSYFFHPSMADYVIKYYIYIYSRSILDYEEQYGEIQFYIIELEKQLAFENYSE